MFYERLREICKMRGTKLTPLLEKINIPTSSTGHWKHGSIPNGDTLIKLAEALDVSLDYLLGRNNDPTPPGKENSEPELYPGQAKDLAKLAEALKELSAEEVKIIRKFVDSLIPE